GASINFGSRATYALAGVLLRIHTNACTHGFGEAAAGHSKCGVEGKSCRCAYNIPAHSGTNKTAQSQTARFNTNWASSPPANRNSRMYTSCRLRIGCSSEKFSRAGRLTTTPATKNTRPKMMVTAQSRAQTIRSFFFAMRRNHSSKTSGAKIPIHSYHSQRCSRKYDRVCRISRYASVTGGKNPSGNRLHVTNVG